MLGCLIVIVGIVVLPIAGCSIWASLQPKDVTYDDVLTTENATTFPEHNAHWNNDDPDNVAYVQRAMTHLGGKAFGHKFGHLMDWEKDYETTQEDKKQAAYYKLHPTPVPTPEPPDADAVIAIGWVADINKAGDGTPCYDTREALDEAIHAVVTNDKYGLQQAVSEHLVAMLHEGDHVRAIDSHGLLSMEEQLRIESSANEGAACWVATGAPIFVHARDGS
jgi:hypothetical protein